MGTGSFCVIDKWSTLWLYADFALCRYRPRDAQDLRLLPVPESDRETLQSLHATLATRPDSARIHFNGKRSINPVLLVAS